MLHNVGSDEGSSSASFVYNKKVSAQISFTSKGLSTKERKARERIDIIGDKRFYIAVIKEANKPSLKDRIDRKFNYVKISQDNKTYYLNVNSIAKRCHLTKSEIRNSAEKGNLIPLMQTKAKELLVILDQYEKLTTKYELKRKLFTKEFSVKENGDERRYTGLTSKTLMNVIKVACKKNDIEQNKDIELSDNKSKRKFLLRLNKDNLDLTFIRAQIGAGGFGDVHQVESLSAGQELALKYAKTDISDEKIIDKIKNERVAIIINDNKKKGIIIEEKDVTASQIGEITDTNIKNRKKQFREKAATDVQNEYNILTEIHNGNIGSIPGIQDKPTRWVVISGKTSDENKVGYFGTKYKEDYQATCQGRIQPDSLTIGQTLVTKEHLLEFYQLLSGLNYLEKKKILHGDIKPENILVKGDGIVHISDFGGACFTKSREHNTESENNQFIMYKIIRRAGTRKYTPAKDRKLANKAAYTDKNLDRLIEIEQKRDVFAMGCVLFEAITGDAPYTFDKKKGHPIIFDKKGSPITPHLDAPSGIQELILSMIQGDLDQRPKASEAFAMLDRYIKSNPKLAEEVQRRFPEEM
jgi:serine/threonine protein kinase